MHLSRLALAGALILSTTAANAAVISFALDSFGSDPVPLTVTLDDESMPGFLTFSGMVGADPTGDILGAFLDIQPSLATFDLMNDVIDVEGNLTDIAFNSTDLGGGNNVTGEIVNQGFVGDLAFAFGTPGIGSDDIKTFTLKLAGLTVADVNGVAVRVTSIGSPGGAREGSDKLFLGSPDFPPVPNPQEVPEPATLSLVGLALLGLVALKKRR